MSASAAEAATVFRDLAARWHLDDSQAAALLGVSEDDLRLPNGAGLGEDARARIAQLIAVSRALNTLYSHHLADGWMLRPLAEPPFEGQWPLDVLVDGGLPAFVSLREKLEARL